MNFSAMLRMAMGDDNKSKPEEILNAISGALDQLASLEESYTATKRRIAENIASSLGQLADLADSQDVRAAIVRDLYWYKRVSPQLISQAFGLKLSAVRTLAGSLVLEVPCRTEGCENICKEELTSILRLKDHLRGGTYRYCDKCEKKSKKKYAADSARYKEQERLEREAARLRNEELRDLPWLQYVETLEWTEKRNQAISENGYRCEFCRASETSLYVFPHKDTPQHDQLLEPINFLMMEEVHLERGTFYRYYVVCRTCIPRCSGLVNEGKYELVKKDYLPVIRRWEQGQDFEA